MRAGQKSACPYQLLVSLAFLVTFTVVTGNSGDHVARSSVVASITLDGAGGTPLAPGAAPPLDDTDIVGAEGAPTSGCHLSNANDEAGAVNVQRLTPFGLAALLSTRFASAQGAPPSIAPADSTGAPPPAYPTAAPESNLGIVGGVASHVLVAHLREEEKE